jgi:hypothetical protein
MAAEALITGARMAARITTILIIIRRSIIRSTRITGLMGMGIMEDVARVIPIRGG